MVGDPFGWSSQWRVPGKNYRFHLLHGFEPTRRAKKFQKIFLWRAGVGKSIASKSAFLQSPH
jgi:hypothetical protein